VWLGATVKLQFVGAKISIKYDITKYFSDYFQEKAKKVCFNSHFTQSKRKRRPLCGLLNSFLRQCPSLQFGHLVIELKPNIFVQKLKVHSTLLKSLTAEESPDKPLTPFLAIVRPAASGTMIR
jgi:hypothetical protein